MGSLQTASLSDILKKRIFTFCLDPGWVLKVYLHEMVTETNSSLRVGTIPAKLLTEPSCYLGLPRWLGRWALRVE